MIKIKINDKELSERKFVQWVKNIMVHGNTKDDNIEKEFSVINKRLTDELGKINIKKSFDELLTIDFRKIKNIIDTIEHEGVKFGSYARNEIKDKPFKDIYNGFDKFVRKKCNIDLINIMGLSVCPYCNRNFVNTRGSNSSAQIDHFYPRSQYPIFALSLYNLVPSCYACNHIKREQLISLSPHDEYNIDEMFKFSYNINSLDFMYDVNNVNLEIRTQNMLDRRFEENLNILQLRDAYKIHNRDVQILLKKALIFSETRISELYDEYSELFNSRKEVERLVFGSVMSEHEYKDNVLAKLKNDIIHELIGYQ